MELRNLSRYLLTRKALSKFNKKAIIELTPNRLTALLVLYTMQRTGIRTTQANTYAKFAKVGLTLSWRNAYHLLEPMIEAGLIEKIGPEFKLTTDGIDQLLALNKILSRERFDR